MKRIVKNEDTIARSVVFQPGDGTKYRFFIIREGRYFFVTDRSHLGAFELAPWQVSVFRDDYGALLHCHAREYQNAVLDDDAILLTCKSWAPKGVNPWTMLAALVCCAELFD